jgi:hypothetical protein
MEVSVNTETATSPTRTTARGKGPNLRLVPPPPKLSAKCAREHAAAEAKVAKAKKTYDDAVAEREKLRVRDRKKLPSKEEVVERYMLGQLPTAGPTDARYCSHCDTRWIGRREPKAKAAA